MNYNYFSIGFFSRTHVFCFGYTSIYIIRKNVNNEKKIQFNLKKHYYKYLFAEEIDSDCKLESTYKLDNRCYYFFYNSEIQLCRKRV